MCKDAGKATNNRKRMKIFSANQITLKACALLQWLQLNTALEVSRDSMKAGREESNFVSPESRLNLSKKIKRRN